MTSQEKGKRLAAERPADDRARHTNPNTLLPHTHKQTSSQAEQLSAFDAQQFRAEFRIFFTFLALS